MYDISKWELPQEKDTGTLIYELSHSVHANHSK